MFIRQPNISTVGTPVFRCIYGRCTYFLPLVISSSWKTRFDSSLSFGRCVFQEAILTSDLESPRCSAKGNLVIFFPEKLIELWAKNRILEADLFAFDRDTHPYDFTLVGGKRLVWYVMQTDISGDMQYFVFCCQPPAAECWTFLDNFREFWTILGYFRPKTLKKFKNQVDVSRRRGHDYSCFRFQFFFLKRFRKLWHKTWVEN